MIYRRLGKTDLRVPLVAFGAGPVPALMTGGEGSDDSRVAVLRRALDLGVDWFDTAAGYGEGASERNLGESLARLGALDAVRIATKVRLAGDDFLDIATAVRRSVVASLERLRVTRVVLLQLHNAITLRRGDEAASISLDDVLGPRGVVEAFRRLRDDGLVDWFGFTGTGRPELLNDLAASGQFDTVQAPYNLLNPSAGQSLGEEFPETNYGNLFAECSRSDMGIFAIRVLAGGALVGQAPSAHTFRTPYFPLDLYRRDEQRAAEWRARLDPLGVSLAEAAVRFALEHPAVSSAIIGFNSPAQITEIVEYANRSRGGSPTGSA